MLLSDPALIQSFGDQLTALEGKVLIDSDLDLLNELTVEYERDKSRVRCVDDTQGKD